MVRWSGVQLVLFGNFASSAMLVFVSVHITPSLIFLKSAENAFLKCVRSISHADARPWPTMPDVGQSRAKSGKVGQGRAKSGTGRAKSGITMGGTSTTNCALTAGFFCPAEFSQYLLPSKVLIPWCPSHNFLSVLINLIFLISVFCWVSHVIK